MKLKDKRKKRKNTFYIETIMMTRIEKVECNVLCQIVNINQK